MTESNIHINKVFAESIYAEYKRKRYGIKSCNARVDADYAYDMKMLLKRNEELQSCNLKLDACSIESIQERINTL